MSPYYITLLAQDSVSGSHQIFQVLVNERSVGKLNIIVPIARPKGKHSFLSFFLSLYTSIEITLLLMNNNVS